MSRVGWMSPECHFPPFAFLAIVDLFISRLGNKSCEHSSECLDSINYLNMRFGIYGIFHLHVSIPLSYDGMPNAFLNLSLASKPFLNYVTFYT